jgi:glycosyltransferase involved in cell wall biosynthesis
MKLAWFTPFCRTSSIGRFGNVIATALAQIPGCEIEIWTHQDGDLHATGLAVRHFDAAQLSARDLAGYDHVIYNLGNHLEYHQPIFEMAQRHPGVVILHDYCMHHFFAGYYLTHVKSAEKYLHAVEVLYGPEVRRKAARGLKGGGMFHETEEVVDSPFWEPCLDNAKAVVVHSRFAAALVRAKSRLPMAISPHPHFRYGSLEKVIPLLDRGRVGSDGKVHLLTLGHVNPNKRTHTVLDVLGKNPDLKNSTVFHVIGPLDREDYVRSLRDRIARYDLGGTVELLGYQPDDVLYDYLCAVNVCINLRHPVFETGSGSLIESMCFGLPTIVSNIGTYLDMPESCVVRIPLEDEERCLEQAIRMLVTDSERRRQLSHNARQHVCTHCTAEIYVEKLMGLLGLLQEDKEVPARFLGRVKRELAAMGHSRGNRAVAEIAREIARFCP